MPSDSPASARLDPTGADLGQDPGTDLIARVAARLAAGSVPAPGVLLLEEVERALGVRAWLALQDRSSHGICWVRPDGGEPFPLPVVPEGGLLRAVLREGRDTIVEDPAGSPECTERRHMQRSGGSWAFLTMNESGRPVGCLVLRADAPAALTPSRLAPVRIAMSTVALALQAARLHRELEERVEERTGEISLLYDVSRSLGFVLSPEDLDHLVAGSLGRALEVDLCALTLLVPDHRVISVHLFGPTESRAVHRLRREILAELARTTGGRPRRLRASVTGPESTGGARLGPGDIRSVAHAPLVIRGQIVGLVSVASREADAFGAARLRLVYTIASQASLTLDRMRAAREAETSRIHSMLASMVDGVLLLDRELNVVMTNPAAQAYLTVLEGRIPETLGRLGDVALRPLLTTLAEPGGKPCSFEVNASVEGRIFSITCSPVRGLDESAQGLVIVISDVTEARLLQLQFAQSEKLSALGEMISGVAHELNNPLASVMGFAQILQSEPVDEGIRRKLVAIDAEATRCRRIVQNLLRFARHHPPERRPLDVHSAIDNVLQLLGHQLQVDDITVELDFQPGLRPVIGDLHLLQQVFLNIVFNAYQAMKEKGGPGRLLIRTRHPAGRVVIEIADDGPGIAPQNLKRIFDPFFSTKEVGQGTGLGLSLAYGTVREHGGTITTRSVHGAGSTFIVDLPAAPEGTIVEPETASLEIAPATPDPEAVGASASETRSAPTGRRILIVEDESSLAEVMAEVLQTLGHVVDTAGDGLSARALVGTQKYDAIVSDLKMPHMNGREFHRHVMSIDPTLARRIVFSSGDTASPDTQSFLEEVGNPFLAKPFNLKDLIRVVESVLGAA